MKDAIQEFNKYSKKFDLKNKNIMRKYHHSFRVMEFSKKIAISLKLSEEEIYIATLCGLLHDIARFEQWTQHKTYIDAQSFDHGDYGVIVLKTDDFIKKFVQDDEIISIVINSTRYHNKATVPILEKNHQLFANIVRDADKLDIITEQGNSINTDKIELKTELLDSIYNEQICRNEYVKNDVDLILRMLSWIFDFNFKYSFDYLIDKKIIENKFNLLEMYGETEETIKLKKWIMKKINEKTDEMR